MQLHRGTAHRALGTPREDRTFLFEGLGFPALAEIHQSNPYPPIEPLIRESTPTVARGTSDVTFNAEPPYDTNDGVILNRKTVTKRFEGDIEGASTVEMISVGTPIKGSAGYVGIERVMASVHGRTGTFVLQHSGTMNRGEATLSVTVVPDSGTAELQSITGRLAIDMVDGKYAYTFEYSIDSNR